MNGERTNENSMTWPMRRTQARLGRPLADLFQEWYVEQGMTLAEVGEKMGGRSEATMSRWMARLGIERRFPGRQPKAAA